MIDPDAKSKHGVIPVTQEELEVSRRKVETGSAVRVRKRVDEAVVDVDETVTIEHVETQRVPIGRPLAEPVGVRQEGDVTVIPVMEERLVRQWVLVEEIRITRRREQVPARQGVVLKRDRVVVERLDPETQQWLPEEGS